MATGILGKASIQAGVYTLVYTVPDEATASVNISLCNTGTGQASVWLALCEGSEPAPGEFIEHGLRLPASGSFERTGLVLQSGRSVIAQADNAGVNVVVYGFEE